MGLIFTVGNPADVFTEPFAEWVKLTFADYFDGEIVVNSETPPYYSSELGWSGWQSLQKLASDSVGAENVRHLLSMEAWSGCYVPVDIEPCDCSFEGHSTPLAVASLLKLMGELERLGSSLNLPVDDLGLKNLVTHYLAINICDDDMDIQTYIHLLLAGRIALNRKQVLWIVK